MVFIKTITLGVDIIADVKAVILNTAQGDVIEAVLSVIGTILRVGSFGNAGQVGKIASKFTPAVNGGILSL